MNYKYKWTLIIKITIILRANRAEQRKNFWKIEEIFNIFKNNIKNAFIPGEGLTVDEQLYAFRGRCPFRQYMPNKPSKYGIKYWSICDVETKFLLDTEIYLGKDCSVDERDRDDENINSGLDIKIITLLLFDYYILSLFSFFCLFIYMKTIERVHQNLIYVYYS